MSNANVNTTNQMGQGQEVSSVEMKTFYDTELIRNAEPLLVHDRFGQKRFIPKNGGKTIEFRKLNPFPKATQPLTEGVTPDGKKLDWSKLSATVNQYGDYVTVSDMLDLTAVDNNILEATVVLGDQAGRTLDTVTREVINAGTNVQYPHNHITKRVDISSSDVITVEAVKKAISTLKKSGAKKIDGSYVAIIHSDVAYDLMNDYEWKSVKEYNPENWLDGEIGRIYGCRFIETNEAKIFEGEDLLKSSRTITVVSISESDDKVIVIEETITPDDAKNLVGRKIYRAGATHTIVSASAEDNTITIDKSTKGTDIMPNCVLFPGEGGQDGMKIYSTLFFGADAYGVTEVEGGGLQTIIKQLGSAGSGDPLNQRATVGWKAVKTAAILSQPFMVRLETASSLNSEY